MTDLIDRQAAIQAIRKSMYADKDIMSDLICEGIAEVLNGLPSAQSEPLSDAYVNVVWEWLLDYQIKAAKLQGRYTPYEVLSWVANDWRKEHE